MRRAYISYIIFCLSFLLPEVNAQSSIIKNTPQNHNVYTAQDGFKIVDIQSVVFDDQDWLWISGISPDPNEFKLNVSKAAIQRFNGSLFQDIALPNIEGVLFENTYIKKRADGLFYVFFEAKENSKLYLLNPRTLIFTPIPLPQLKNFGFFQLSFFPYKEAFLIFISNNENNFILKLSNDLKITKLSTIPNRKHIYVTSLAAFDDHFIVNDRSGVLTFDSDGTFKSVLESKALGVDPSLIDYKLTIGSMFKHKGHVYANFFVGKNDYYQYDPDLRTWHKTDIFNTVFNESVFALVNNTIRNDSKGNTLKIELRKNGLRILRYLKDLDRPDFSYDLKLTNIPHTASRNFEKEVFIANEGKLHHIIFESPNFSIFLNNYSIRGILPLGKEEALVATENKGWFKINLKTKEAFNYDVTLKGVSYSPDQNRGFFKTSEGYWSSYNKGIVHVNDKYRTLKSYIHYPVATMVEDSTSIYYGTYAYKLMKFDKATGTHTVLADTDTLDVQHIVKKDDIIYGATGSGLLVYEAQQAIVYKINDNADDNFLLSIDYTDPYGLLVGSRSGKLYHFNPITKSFELLYQDDLQASIASFLLDKQKRIWLNTFSGIVVFNPKNKSTTRYGENDGMSYNESNRYSAAITEDGYFLVGTLKGLNYFHPDSLSKTAINATLKFSALRYYNKETKTQILELSSEKLSKISKINLPEENRNLMVQFGLFGVFINESISYRYRLNKQAWSLLTKKNEVNLINLASGDYILEIEAVDATQQKIGESLYLKIRAKDFFYKSVWFYLMLTLLLGLLGYWYVLQLKKRHKLKEQFATQLINTQENDRSRIAKELHDSIGQKLLLLKNTILMKQGIQKNDLTLVEDTINEVRNMSHNLHPFQFEQLGLTQSLHNVIDAFQKNAPTFFSAEIDEIQGVIPKEKEIFIFRMIQESISNVVKHADATACNLQVTKSQKYIYFILKDNGKGFDPKTYENSILSLGLKTLKERTQYIDAQLEISSAPQKGTIITITVPTA
ncbi:sensor histidine kinase [Mariniflexile litorale]|uniref:histidine kinase n=1 Tax=Mariniflexile litorale TaxID=3045158 RepID=A0AAU7EEC9_9FLAO|nr:sensor histidine kinase [Mariniflexile sp. KMM 9835]MDQ8211992.1 sensor histidine kinase [Mariniflexile sp. KMM 9835]